MIKLGLILSIHLKLDYVLFWCHINLFVLLLEIDISYEYLETYYDIHFQVLRNSQLILLRVCLLPIEYIVLYLSD